MSKRFITIFLSFVFLLSLISSSGGFESNANKDETTPNPNDQRPYTRDNAVKPLGQGGYYGGHDTIISEGMMLKEQVHEQTDSDSGAAFRKRMVEEALPNLRTGAHDEDTSLQLNGVLNDPPIGPNGWGDFFQHFYNPDSETGLKKVFNPATKKAKDYIGGVKIMLCELKKNPLDKDARERLYDYLGRIMHLLQDMAVPSHTKNDIHVFTKPFENHVNDHWNDIINSDAFKNAVTPQKYLEGNYGNLPNTDNPVFSPDQFMKTLAKKSQTYPNEEELIDQIIDPYTGALIKEVNTERLMKNVNELIPEAVKNTAGYMNTIYDFMNKTISGGMGELDFCNEPPDPPSPSNDHPDDRFDVSDEFYWEKNYGISEIDLTDLYLRTAIKKGKVGVWYKKRFMEIFIEGRTTYKDAPQETKDAIEREFQSIGRKLEQRTNQAESDWKGSPDVALFANGFYNPSISLMLKIGEPVAFRRIDFDPAIVRDHPVMLVPTGGFYGLKNSSTVKALLDEYVKSGGTLVLFTQQHGYDWDLLPVPINPENGERKPVMGYGYQEDQSCQFNSVYIDTYHPMLSVFSTSTANIGVDGYFSSYPDNSTILLRRVSNGQPAMIMYPYGSGHVIATTMYTDFAFTHNQTNQTEINFIQNIISWAKKPEDVLEVRPEQAADLNINVSNFMDTGAASLKFMILDPSRKVISEQTQLISIPAGQSGTIPVTYTTTPTSTLGVYHIDYILYDSSGTIIQPQAETDSGRFVVSNPPSNPYKSPDFGFSVQSDAEYYVYGSPATFTFILWNHTDRERQVTVRGNLSHHRTWIIKTVTIPPRGSTQFTYILERVIDLDRCFTWFYDENGKQVGLESKGIWVVNPSVNITVTTDKHSYAKGETVTINTSIKNNVFAGWQPLVKVTVTDPLNAKILEDSKIAVLPPDGVGSITTTLTLPTNSKIGFYYVRTDVFHEFGRFASAAETFVLPDSQISVTANLPYPLTPGPNTIAFVLNNMGRINVGSGILDINLKDPDGMIVDSQSYPFSLAVGESKTLDVSISIPLLKFGRYGLTYIQSDETKTGGPTTVIIPNTITTALSFDKPFFKIRESANLTVDLTNTGKFNLDNVSVRMSAPDVNYTDSKTISLGVNPDATSLTFTIPIPETITAGQHNVNVTVTLPSGATLVKNTSFTVPESKLAIDYSGTNTLAAGDTINLSIENTGGVDTTYTTQKLSINDSHEVEIYRGSVTGTILTGEKKTLMDIQIPAQVLNGPAYLIVQMKDSKTEKTVYYDKPIEMRGLTATLQTMTDKNAYLITEAITGISSILNGPFGIEEGSMKVSVNKISQATTGQFTHFLPKQRGVIFSDPGGVAVGSDGSVYVAEGNHHIQKFDSNGNFIRKWGSYCNVDSDGDGIVDQSCDGQFNYPYSIAVGPDGLLYVADTENHRIQKFDSNGNFIRKWGSYCATDTNWDGIPDQSCGDGQFNSPGPVAVGADGSVYVADGNHRIQKFDSNGVFISKWGSYCQADTDWDGIPDQPCDGQFYYPGAVAVGADGSVYVADGNHHIQKFDSNGTFITKWGSYCITDTNGDGISEQSCEGRFNYPSGIAIGTDGLVYIVESGNARIQKFDSTGTFITKWGSYCSIDSDWDGVPDQACEGGQFADPYGIAMSPDGSVYVVDTSNNRIQKFDSNGTFIMKWGSGSAGSGDGEFGTPYGVTVGYDGSIYITDSGNNRIQKFDSNGNFITKWGSFGSEDGQFSSPIGAATGSDGSVYVADTGNNRIQKFDSNGNFISKWLYVGAEQGFHRPLGIAAGSDGSVYVADTYNYRLEKFDSNGNLITQWEISGGECGEVNCPPTGIAVGPDGAVYVVDPYNFRIHKFNGNGNFITYWEYNGAACDEICGPTGIGVGPDGSVYVADTSDSLIQKYDANGSLVAEWGSYGSEDGQFYNPGGIAVAPDGSIYIADTGNHCIQKTITVTTEYIAETLFETTIPINQPASTTQDYTTNIGTLSVTGKLQLQAILKNSLGQTMGQASYPFYIVGGNTVLLFNTDKKVYKPGETVTITGQVENRATIEAVGLTLTLHSKLNTQNPQLVFTDTFNIPAGGTHPFAITTNAETQGTVILTGKVSQNNSTVVEITDQYEVAESNVSVAMSVPDGIGSGPFNIDVEIRNTGKGAATIQFGVQSSETGSEFGDSQTITISPGEMKILQYSQQISKDTTYTLTFTGDLELTLTKTVHYGLAASIAMNPQAVSPEGNVAIPFTITNTGQMAENLAIDFTLSPGDLTQTKTYYLQPGVSTTDTLYFNLTEGDYQITATSQKPDASVQASLSVRKENQVQMGVSLGTQTDGLVPVNVNLTNNGFNTIEGTVQISVIDSAGATAWNGYQGVTLPSSSTPSPSTEIFNINPSALPPGDYTLKAELLSNSSQQISVQSSSFGVQGATFQLTQMPPYQTFPAGQEATFTFKVKNTGNQEGSIELRFKAYDLIDSTQREWLKPNEEKAVTFGFMLPEDLEEKDYFADYELKASVVAGQSKGQIKYHLAGISLNVNASLDKPYYTEGETAHLTINIQTSNPAPQNLFARVNYAGYEPQQTFTLSGNQVLIFDIPLPKITGEKLFYGIYHEGGRSIHLNSVYIHKAGDVITITTNKQVYNPSETVSVTASGNTGGTLTLSGPGGYAETLPFSGQVTRNFTLPATVTAGTYFISYQLLATSGESYTGTYPLDVAGIQVKVLECNNDKGKYASSDTIATSFTISSNTTMPAILKAWIVDPTGQYTSVGEQNITLSSPDSSLITYNSALNTSVSGIHRLVYGIYGPEDLLLCSGSEAFDVGDAVLLGISTDKVDYPQGNESVVVKAGLYGSVTASLEFYLDGQSAGNQSVSLNGFSALDYMLPSVTPGRHALKGVLTAGGLTSTKETTFTYGSGLPDLTLRLSWDQVIGQSSLNLSITAANQGKSPSGATTLHLYDGEISGGKLLSAFDIPTLSQGQSQTLTYELNLLGRAGTNTLSGVIDPSNTVYEFNESNNGDQITFTVPEITLFTTLEKDVYFIGETVPVTSLITNLSKNPLAGLVLFTEVKDQSEAQVFTNSQPITTIEAMTTGSLLTSWPTDTQLPEGVYTIRQSILGKEIHTQKSLTFVPGKDFTITTDTAIKKIEVGEAAEYHLQLTPLKAFKGEIHLSLSGYPQNSTAYFTPNPVTITESQAQSILTMIPPNQAGAGSYSMKVIATGGGISHDLNLSLNLTDFEMILHPTSQTLPQLEKANYTITLNSVNGFDHGVTLEVNDIPLGMRASLSAKEVVLPQSVTLILETSKWLLPGEYRIPIVAKARTVTHPLTAILIVQKNPSNFPGIVTVPGLVNKPIIHTFNLSGGLLSEFQVVDGGLGVNISAGDVNGDGMDEVIAGTGWKLFKMGRVEVFRRDGTRVAFMETEQGYVSDLTVAAGDFDGDWIEEVAIGFYKSPLSDPLHWGGGVKVYKVIGNRFIDTGLLLQPYESEGYFGPPNLTVSDVDGDGVPELITAPGPDPWAPAKIKVFKIDTSGGVGQWRLGSQIMDFIVPFNVNGFGAHVAAGDLDGDGCAEIIVGAGPDPRKKAEVVIVYHGDGGYEFERFTAYQGLLFGVNIAATDVDGDGISEILTGPGPDPRSKSKVRIFRRDGTLIREFQAYPDNTKFGVKVSTGKIGE